MALDRTMKLETYCFNGTLDFRIIHYGNFKLT